MHGTFLLICKICRIYTADHEERNHMIWELEEGEEITVCYGEEGVDDYLCEDCVSDKNMQQNIRMSEQILSMFREIK